MNFDSLCKKTDSVFVGDVLADGESPFSTNKVTGHSLNYPIALTCSPTKVCIKTCYFGSGPSTWTAALRKQWRLYNSTTRDPAGTAKLIASYAARLRLSFVRWNGGGDLFKESVECINIAASLMPDIPQWVVTRLPHFARAITPAANVFVHFSVDKSSMARLSLMRGYEGKWFWSYQCDKGESPPPRVAPVVFYDHYDPNGSDLTRDDCPLNSSADITGVCGGCRRCFDGSAVSRAMELSAT